MVRIVLALLSLLTAHRPARAGQERTAPAWPGAAGPYQAGRFAAGTGDGRAGRPRRPGGSHRPAGRPAGGRAAGRTGRPPRMAT